MASRPTREGSWQAEKSENTRNAIMEAAIRAYIEIGYANTTVTKISDLAGVSRGAMMHHFDSRLDIIKASVHYLMEKRLGEFNHLIGRVSRPEHNVTVEKKDFEKTIDALWEFFHIPSFTAYQELLMAARTDEELAKILDPAQKGLDKRIADSINAMFPVWYDKPETRNVLTDLFFFTLQGMAISKIANKKQTRVKNLLNLLAQDALIEFKK